MSNKVIARAGAGKIGAVGAAEAACIDLGAIRKVEFTFDQEVYVATDAASNDMEVENSLGAIKCGLKLTLEDFTAANIAKALGATDNLDGTVSFSASGTSSPYYAGYFHGFKIAGTARVLHVCRFRVKPGSSFELSNSGAQQLIELDCQIGVDPDSSYDYDVFSLEIEAAAEAAPTFAVVPADDATAVAKAATTVVTFTSPVAILSEDVDEAHFFVIAADDSIKAGALAIGATNKVVTFTPTAAWAATTKFHPTAMKGIRNLAGVKSVATVATNFTTGA